MCAEDVDTSLVPISEERSELIGLVVRIRRALARGVIDSDECISPRRLLGAVGVA